MKRLFSIENIQLLRRKGYSSRLKGNKWKNKHFQGHFHNITAVVPPINRYTREFCNTEEKAELPLSWRWKFFFIFCRIMKGSFNFCSELALSAEIVRITQSEDANTLLQNMSMEKEWPTTTFHFPSTAYLSSM